MSTVKGPVVEGKLKGAEKLSYIPFSDDGQEKPVLATEAFAMPRTGASLSAPFPLAGIQGGNKPWLAKYISGTKHTDAPKDLSTDSQYLIVGGREYGNGTYRGIGYGYVSDPTQIAPVFAGMVERSTTDNTFGDFVIATRNNTNNEPPVVRMSVTHDGNLLASAGYKPSAPLSLATKEYVDKGLKVYTTQAGERYTDDNLPDVLIVDGSMDNDITATLALTSTEYRRFWFINHSDKHEVHIFTDAGGSMIVGGPNTTSLVAANKDGWFIISQSTAATPVPTTTPKVSRQTRKGN